MWKAGEVEDGTAKKLGKPLEPKLRDAGGCVKLACLSLRRPLSGNVPSKCSDEIHDGGENATAQQKKDIETTPLLDYEAAEDFSIMRHRKKLSARR